MRREGLRVHIAHASKPLGRKGEVCLSVKGSFQRGAAVGHRIRALNALKRKLRNTTNNENNRHFVIELGLSSTLATALRGSLGLGLLSFLLTIGPVFIIVHIFVILYVFFLCIILALT